LSQVRAVEEIIPQEVRPKEVDAMTAISSQPVDLDLANVKIALVDKMVKDIAFLEKSNYLPKRLIVQIKNFKFFVKVMVRAHLVLALFLIHLEKQRSFLDVFLV
jgi:hypothetical protein